MVRLVLVAIAAAASCTAMPLPWTDALRKGATGTGVMMLQQMLARQPGITAPLNATGTFDDATEGAVRIAQAANGLEVDGIVGEQTALSVLATLAADGYRDDGKPPSASGHMFKILFVVPRNRSVQVDGSLIAANGSTVFRFGARLHGVNAGDSGDDVGCPPAAWPAWSNTVGLNQFSPCGNTPTGLALADLNSPEDEPDKYGPYPVVRMVQGLRGNAKFLVPHVRDGILVHTGKWPGWSPGQTLPNSEGCVHAEPESIHSISEILQSMGVKANKNSGGVLPYPYVPQGLLSIVQSGA